MADHGARALYTADVLVAVCAYLPPLARVRLCLLCRPFAAIFAERCDELCADFAPRPLGRGGRARALGRRWRRVGVTQAELGEAFVGACAGCHEALAKKLGLRLQGEAAAKALDEALFGLATGGQLYELTSWVVNECPARPTLPGCHAAFVSACGQGHLGLAQLVYRVMAQEGDAQAAQDALSQGLESASKTARHAHVVSWVGQRLCCLEEARGATGAPVAVGY